MRVILAAALLAAACRGKGDDGPPPPAEPGALGVGQSGARRLSVAELDDTLRDLLGETTRPASVFLPPDVIDPFDNDLASQAPSAVLVTGLEALANDVATRLVADRDRLDEVVGCEPTSATDEGCLGEFVSRWGRLALRRQLTDDEAADLVALGLAFAADGGFAEGVDVIVRALLQHPEFVYRVELGTPADAPGVHRLSGYEVATRLSYLLWGSTPDEQLLDDAEAGLLDDPDGVRAAAERLLADPRAIDRIDRFHAMWLGYWTLPHPPELTTAFRFETRALLTDVVFDRGAPWTDLFTAEGTFASDFLAAHYGLPLPGSDEPVWVPYGSSGRQGLLSHGSFLSVNAKFGDTSPTLRGKLVRERLLCEVVPPPPPSVNVDEPPAGDGSSDCKVDRYAEHRANGTCKSCHDLVDPIGFGLEAFDQRGQFRTHDVGNPECAVDGAGDVDGEPFVGPAGLADLLVAGDTLRDCAVQQAYRLAMGHAPATDDEAFVARLRAGFGPGARLDELLLAIVSDEAFGLRREEEVTP
jgi:hypothetical protein